jgi:hypothetical protein
MDDLRELALSLAHRDEENAVSGGAPDPEKVVTRAIVYAHFLLGYRDNEVAAGPGTQDAATKA